MTWLLLSWMFLCSQFLCYNQTILENPLAYRIAIQRKYKLYPPLPPYEEKKPTDVVWLIKYYSKKHNYNTDVALKIAGCESGYRVDAKNRTSSARWIAQFLTVDFKRADWTWHTSTWTSSSKRYLWYKWDVFNADEHVNVFIQKLKTEWTNAWNASKYCWNK